MKTPEEMIRLNEEQARFYDGVHRAAETAGGPGYSKNASANLLTRMWATLREAQARAVHESGVEERKRTLHTRWIHARRGGRFLEIGCFTGGPLTMTMAEAAGEYVGVELSPRAAATLNGKLEAAGFGARARVRNTDFLLLDEPGSYDLIYGHAVLHHFENFEVLFEKIRSLLRPGGVLIFVEPSACNPMYRTVRALYRPFQTDAAWEWPFTSRTVAALERRFEVIDGFGYGRWSLPLSVLVGFPGIGSGFKSVYLRRIGSEMDRGLKGNVWMNSYVTILATRRETS